MVPTEKENKLPKKYFLIAGDGNEVVSEVFKIDLF